MLGSDADCDERHPNHPGGSLKTKAAENGVLLRFSVYMLQRFGNRVQNIKDLENAGLALMTYLETMRESSLVLKPNEYQKLFDNCILHLTCAERAGIMLQPKHHCWLHMSYRHI